MDSFGSQSLRETGKLRACFFKKIKNSCVYQIIVVILQRKPV